MTTSNEREEILNEKIAANSSTDKLNVSVSLLEDHLSKTLPERAAEMLITGYEMLLADCFNSEQKLNKERLEKTLTSHPQLRKILAAQQLDVFTGLQPEQMAQLRKVVGAFASNPQTMFHASANKEVNEPVNNMQPTNKRK